MTIGANRGSARIPLPHRFGPKIEHSPTGCWLWLGAKTTAGYGTIGWMGKTTLAHRIVFELTGNRIPPGMHLDHLCRVPSCVNPAHLEPVTNRENALRGDRNIYQHTGECSNGHVIAEVGLRKDGIHMRCAACRRIQDWRYKLKTRTPDLWRTLASLGDESLNDLLLIGSMSMALLRRIAAELQNQESTSSECRTD